VDDSTISHFSQANPKDGNKSDVPSLLRRVADSIESLGAIQIQDIVFHDDLADGEPWPHMTVYFHGPHGDEPGH
jgi:hypothetical protein